MTGSSPREEFLQHLATSLREETFVKLTLGKARAEDASLRNLLVRVITLRGAPQFSFVWRHERRDVTKNHPVPAGSAEIEALLGSTFHSAHLFTTTQSWQLEYNKKGEPRLSRGPASAEAPDNSHDRAKARLLPPESQAWLHALGVTNPAGAVREGMADKHRQIHKFVEILSHLTKDARLPADRPIEIADMGCGKGYLTFATHDYFNRVEQREANVTGIEARAELVEKCTAIAHAAGCNRLVFRAGHIDDATLAGVDLLIALHACDTATDDAIMQGVQVGAELIVVAPCCQKELRPQLQAATVLAPALRHGIFQERHAEFVTDALRALLLEWAGYEPKVFEFISTEHTAKNLMIAATKRHGGAQSEATAAKVRDLAAFYGIKRHALAQHLGFAL